ncbi:ATP-dependent RNA helicase RhlE [Gemmobacter megaterium]|uniref:ATP-dependent RNA helicase RhlE n=1 Tax=Gemmobacter megaterium TaxID=1086013 RepID=A0A1N7Q5N7_9RHOB|nr:DEAD/DEAH box helicase [Gemmobacter megaterium]GGE23286.1 DEAD/DEAH box helicase [Gemmobacter megaterium]SIT18153.1 ATP-dependent RNA helicase RhlE [Gemmobacter megaterium]
MTTFADLGLSPNLLKSLERLGFDTPTPIQKQAIPQVLAGHDLMGLAQTGTGKTAAFGLPLLNRILDIGHPPQPRTVRALIMAPTRELVAQIADHLTQFTKGTPVKVLKVIGGASLHKQAEALARGADVLVATPGRLIDLLERRALTLDATGYLVLDEADQMLDMGFIHLLRQIARYLPHKRQTLMFSATMPKLIDEIADAYLRNPVKVAANPPGKTADRIEQAVHFTNQGDKAKLLEDYLLKHPGEAALVFNRTKHGAEKLMKLLVSWGFSAGSIHGNKSQNHRERTLAAFRAGELDVLVATDVAARGIDIPLVRHVYNYDLPNVPDNYVHRIGRTARAGASGKAVAFCAPAEMDELKAIEKVTGQPLPVIGGAPYEGATARPSHAPRRPGQDKPQGPRKSRPQSARSQGDKPHGAKPQGAKPGQRSDGKPAGQRSSRPAQPKVAASGNRPPRRQPR